MPIGHSPTLMLLSIALLAPLCGPLLVDALAFHRGLRATFDGFLIVAIGGLLGVHVLPEGLAALGWPGVPALLLGLALPKLLHAHDHIHEPEEAHQAPSSCARSAAPSSLRLPSALLGILGALALALHAAADGLALAPAVASEGADSLALAVGLHRLIEGAGLWWLLKGRLGAFGRVLALIALTAATALGFACGHWAVAHGFVQLASVLQMVVAGSLLHLLVWHSPSESGACSMPRAPAPGRGTRLASAIGAVLACVVLFSLEQHHDHAHGGHRHGDAGGAPRVAHRPVLVCASPAADRSLAARWAPRVSQATVVALLCAALAHAAVHVRRAGTRWRPMGPVYGAVRGLFVPACSCGVVALAEARRREGARPSGVVSYLLAAPGMGWVGFWLSLLLLGPAITLLRATAVVLSGTLVGSIVGCWPARGGHAAPRVGAARDELHAHAPQGYAARLLDGAQFAFGEMLDFTGPWVSFSLLLVAVVASNVPATWITVPAQLGIDPLLLAVLAVPPYLCAAASTLVAVCVLHAGASAGAVITLLMLTSSLSIASITAVARWHGPRAAAVGAGLQVATATVAGVGVNALSSVWPLWDLLLWPPAVPDGGSSIWLWVAVALLVVSLTRQGLRGFVGQILWANGAQEPSAHHH